MAGEWNVNIGTILKGKHKNSEKNVSYHKSHMVWRRIEPEPMRAVIIVKYFSFSKYVLCRFDTLLVAENKISEWFSQSLWSNNQDKSILYVASFYLEWPVFWIQVSIYLATNWKNLPQD